MMRAVLGGFVFGLVACGSSSSGGGGGGAGDASVGGSSGSGGAVGGTGGSVSGGSAGIAADSGPDASGGGAGDDAGTDAGWKGGSIVDPSGCTLPALTSTLTPGSSAIYFNAKTIPSEINPSKQKLYRASVQSGTVGASSEVPTTFWMTSVVGSSDGRRLALGTKVSPFGNVNEDLYVMDSQAGSSHAHCLVPKPTPGEGIESVTASWSPDGKWLVFQSAVGFDPAPVYATNLSTPITSWEIAPAANLSSKVEWSSDGRFAAYRGDTALYVTDLEAGPPFGFGTVATLEIGQYGFVPGTQTLVYIENDQLWARNLAAGVPGTAVPVSPATTKSVESFSFSDDGARLAYADQVPGFSAGGPQLLLMAITNGMPSGASVPGLPEASEYGQVDEYLWGPDSKRILTRAAYEQAFLRSVYLVDATTLPPGVPTPVIESTQGNELSLAAAWSPAGNLVGSVFGNPSAQVDVYVSDVSQATPGAPQKLSKPNANPVSVRFSPTGARLAVVANVPAGPALMLGAESANLAAGLSLVTAAPPPAGASGVGSDNRWTPDGVLLFIGDMVTKDVHELFAWNGTGSATRVNPAFTSAQQRVFGYVVVPQ
jgi:Tol biopolymer transport system component